MAQHPRFAAALAFVLSFGIAAADAAGGARCTGAANCRVCKTCSDCTHCRSGGTCGTCRVAAEPSSGEAVIRPSTSARRGRAPSKPPAPSPTPIKAGDPFANPATDVQPGPIRVVVVRVLDGDTVEVLRGANRVKVRLLGIDAPESSSAAFGKKELGLRAAEFLKGEVLQKQVALELDGPQLDRYGRTLAYLTRKADGVNVNQLMVEKGYAVAYTAYPCRLMPEFRAAEAEARRKKAGLWGDGQAATVKLVKPRMESAGQVDAASP